jgi:DNA repair protein RadA/Sms
MGKVKTAYFCQNCGAQSPQWIGKCPSCGEWNTFVEEVIKREEPAGTITEIPLARRPDHPQPITAIAWDETDRVNTYDQEFNRVLGGGLVPGSLILIGGEPGIGKSTLMLQVGLLMKPL